VTGLRDAVRAATERLRAAGVHSPESDAIALAAHVLGGTPADVHRAMALGADAPAAYAEVVDARASRTPLQHLTGVAAFRRLELAVGPGVFVPRPETEVVAGIAVEVVQDMIANGTESPVVVDLCTGSGAIALSIKDEAPRAEVHAVEVSDLARGWAERNVELTGLDVHLVLADARSALPELEGRVDVVVSNPPYIPSDQVPVDPEVRDHDPAVALYGGSTDGLAIPRLVAARAAALLRAGGVLVLEHADTQGESLPAALERSGHWRDVRDHLDLNRRPRATTAVRAPRLTVAPGVAD
jgi:release factor glutamine methyltransferase